MGPKRRDDLDLLALVTVLTHTELPVLANRAFVERYDSLHDQAKSQVILDAGAFESTLRKFNPTNCPLLVSRLRRRL